jgi:transcriptional regulator with XRE-family HTH domain
MIEDSSQFGAAVASARKALGLTQRKLALAINSGQRFIVD